MGSYDPDPSAEMPARHVPRSQYVLCVTITGGALQAKVTDTFATALAQGVETVRARTYVPTTSGEKVVMGA